HDRIVARRLLDRFPGAVGRSVVEQDQFAVEPADAQHLADAGDQLGDVGLLVEAGDDDRELHAAEISMSGARAPRSGAAARRSVVDAALLAGPVLAGAAARRGGAGGAGDVGVDAALLAG